METYRRRRSGGGGVSLSCVVAVTALWVGMVAQCVVADHEEEARLGAAVVANSKYFRHMTFPNHQVEGVVSTERRAERRAESHVSFGALVLQMVFVVVCTGVCVCLLVRHCSAACSGCVVVVVFVWVPCLVAFILVAIFGLVSCM